MLVFKPPVASALFLYFIPESSIFVCDEVTRLNPSCLSSVGASATEIYFLDGSNNEAFLFLAEANSEASFKSYRDARTR
jgi:hypothetical protein